MKKILILSGKGGTGKTTVASNFINISQSRVFADCDVEAPNLHLVSMVKSEKKRENYYGLDKSVINQDLCLKCGLCKESCKFNAINFQDNKYVIDKYSCEGCGVCNFICPANAIDSYQSIDGEIIIYEEDKIFSTAKLKMGSGNSGLLVTKVKKELQSHLQEDDLVIIDGPPGIGCPVIASMSGVDMILLVAEPSVSGISDLKRIIKTANSFHIKIAICINKFDLNKKLTKGIIKFVQENKYNFVGKISYNTEISKSINEGKFLDQNSHIFKEIENVYNNTIELLN